MYSWVWPALLCPRMQIKATSIFPDCFFFLKHTCLVPFHPPLYLIGIQTQNQSLIFMQPSSAFHTHKTSSVAACWFFGKDEGEDKQRGEKKKQSENEELKRSHRPSKTTDAWFSRPPLTSWRKDKSLVEDREAQMEADPVCSKGPQEAGDHVTALGDWVRVHAGKRWAADADLLAYAETTVSQYAAVLQWLPY